MKSIEIKAGQRTRIISKFSGSIPTDFKFSAAATNGSSTVSGRVEVKGSNWIFPKPAISQPLSQDNLVRKGAWDSFFNVYITPDVDVRIEVPKSSMILHWIIIVLAISVVFAAVAVSFFANG